jgi:hypothetical protein
MMADPGRRFGREKIASGDLDVTPTQRLGQALAGSGPRR